MNANVLFQIVYLLSIPLIKSCDMHFFLRQITPLLTINLLLHFSFNLEHLLIRKVKNYKKK